MLNFFDEFIDDGDDVTINHYYGPQWRYPTKTYINPTSKEEI
jgi:hypothetical protein